MALSREILNESELAKVKIANSDYLDDDYKKSLLNIVNLTTVATNGISPEEKIQKMTEAIHMLAVSEIQFVTSVQDLIVNSIQQASTKQCSQCKAMKHAEEYELNQKQQELIEKWKKANGYIDEEDCPKQSWVDTLKIALTKPYIYVFLTLGIISPYGVQILEKILAFCSK